MKKIDVFNHVLPARFFDRIGDYKDIGKRMREVPMLVDLPTRLRVMDQFPGYVQILSAGMPPIEALAGPDHSPELARICNDGMAELCRDHPERFPGFIASLPLNNPDAAVDELHRAMDTLHARGVQIFSNINGKPLDRPEFAPIFDAMAQYDLPLFLHPARGADFSDYKSESKSRFELWWAFGWPYETSVAMARLVFAGLFERHPAIKIVAHHYGAMIPFFEGRIGPGLDQLGARTSDEDYASQLKHLKRRPIDYFRMFYADTAVFGSQAATLCGLAFFGAARTLFASDAPFDPEKGPMYIRETIRILDALPCSEEDRANIYHRNAERLLKLAPVSPPLASVAATA
ncbi:MAG TPA: amidohydrolase family protein [Casimicrobiaceae bacterium]|nr:amidohydrolase family protein [Casimicrobiaceae bacterium]